MKRYILLTYAYFNIHSLYGAASPMLDANDTSNRARVTVKAVPYRHDPYNAIPRQYLSKLPTDRCETQRRELFKRRAEQVTQCLLSSELYRTAILQFKTIKEECLWEESDLVGLFVLIQDLGNRQYNVLREGVIDRDGNLLEEYVATFTLFKGLIELDLFSTEVTDKLRCYLVTFLMGAANVSGMMRDNGHKVQYAQEVLDVIDTITQDVVVDPYSLELNFEKEKVRHVCNRAIVSAKLYLENLSPKNTAQRNQNQRGRRYPPN